MLQNVDKLSNSQEWVYHDRQDSKDPALVRKYQKVVWDKLFGHIKAPIARNVCYELNTRWLPAGTYVVPFEVSNVEEFLRLAQELLEGTEYSIHITMKAKVVKMAQS